MVKLIKKRVYYAGGKLIEDREGGIEEIKKLTGATDDEIACADKGTMAYSILKEHNLGDEDNLKIKFDAIASHDITYVGIIQTAKASGLKEFPLPYTLTNCHNSLCAVGGTINEDDHLFGLSAAKKYGGDFVPAHLAVIHQYMREMQSGGGKMILGSDSHTRYGALGTMAVGEGGPELVKQLLGKTYDIRRPEVIAVYLKGKVKKGVGPQDVALAIIRAVFANGFVKNKVMEFVGEGIKGLSVDFRNGIDVMTTETTCLSSVWETDEKVREYYAIHRREKDFKALSPKKVALYSGAVVVNLSKILPMIALPFHPSNAMPIAELLENPYDILKEVEERGAALLKNGKYSLTDKIEKGKLRVSQGIIAGCAGGTYENIAAASEILKGKSTGNDAFSLSVYPSSQPVYKAIAENGYLAKLLDCGAIVKTAFCGPCFGAGDVPANNGLSIRHTTRNFESREGSKPGEGQLAAVALMDSRSIAATAANGGILTPATAVEYSSKIKKYSFDAEIYEKRVYRGSLKPIPETELVYGPNIADWPKMPELNEDLLMKVASSLSDPVTTTDELIPSGETSSYRSNPYKLAEFALSRKDPEYVSRAKRAKEEFEEGCDSLLKELNLSKERMCYGSVVAAIKPGDGSAREQAASCQRVLGGIANIAVEYATKRYRSNLINWGMLPFLYEKNIFENSDYILVKEVKEKLLRGDREYPATIIRGRTKREIVLRMDPLTDDEKAIILKGCLINFNKKED